MDKKTAEVLFLMSEYVSDNGRWDQLCGFLESKGISSQQMADAINKAARTAGFTSNLTSEDCE